MSHRCVTAAALGLACTLSPAPLQARAEAPHGLVNWVTVATQQDTVWVHRLGMRLVPRVDSLAAGRRWWSPYMVSNAPVGREWAERFTKLLSDSLNYIPGARCAPADTTARPADDLVVGVDFGTCDSCAFAVCYFHEGCVRLATRRGPVGALSIERGRGRREILGLLSAALPQDDILRNAASAATDSLGVHLH